MRKEVDTRDEVMHSDMNYLWFFREQDVDGRERVMTDEERVPQWG